jgi:hypothetical protein
MRRRIISLYRLAAELEGTCASTHPSPSMLVGLGEEVKVTVKMYESSAVLDLGSKCRCTFYMMRRDSAVGIATAYGLDDRGFGVRVLVGPRIFTSRYRRRPTLRTTQSPIQQLCGTISQGQNDRGVKVTHLHLVPRSRNRGSIHPLPHTSSWRSA